MPGIQMQSFKVVGENQIRCENTFKLEYVICRCKFL